MCGLLELQVRSIAYAWQPLPDDLMEMIAAGPVFALGLVTLSEC